MLKQASLLDFTAEQPAVGGNEKIVIVIEKGKVVWFDTTGKLPPGN